MAPNAQGYENALEIMSSYRFHFIVIVTHFQAKLYFGSRIFFFLI